MKTVEGNRFIITVDKNKPFSIFRINDTLYFNATLREQEIEFFENTFTDYGDRPSPGERKLSIGVNSEEERLHLASLFIGQGFKVRMEEVFWNPGCYTTQRKYMTENDITTETSPDHYESFFMPGSNQFNVYLRRKDLGKFMDFLRVLSEKYDYLTIYNDKNVTRNYLSTLNTKMIYKLQ